MCPAPTFETSARPSVKPLIAAGSAQKVAAVIPAPSCSVKRPLISWIGTSAAPALEGGLKVLCEAPPEGLEVLVVFKLSHVTVSLSMQGSLVKSMSPIGAVFQLSHVSVAVDARLPSHVDVPYRRSYVS